MEGIGIGAEVSQKIRSAIKAKFMEIGIYVDEELPDYVMVMVANKRSKEQMDEDLQLFLGKHTSLFTTWLHQVLQKLQEVTVANLSAGVFLGGVKRRVSEESKKKKKAKLDSEKKEPRNKIKVEREDDSEQDLVNVTNKEKNDIPSTENDGCTTSLTSINNVETVQIGEKEPTVLKPAEEQVKENKNSCEMSERHEENTASSQEQQSLEEKQNTVSKPQSTCSHDDMDDEDYINIRTDGELLDTTEEVNMEETQSTRKEKESPPVSKSKKSADKKRSSVDKSPVISKEKSKQRNSSKQKTDSKKQSPISTNPSPPTTNKVIDARELLNRKKAAKREAESESKTRTKSRDRSVSPDRKRRSDARDNKGYHEERDKVKRLGHEKDRETTSRRDTRDDNKSRKSEGVRDSHVTKKREGRSHRTNFDWDSKKESSARKGGRDSNGDDWSSSRATKGAKTIGNRISDREVDRESEEPRKRGGVLSQVVPRAPEPEEDVDPPVPSVVKVTPRPRRPPSQQPSSTLIMKAISEANRSLANVPPRPDSTQRARKKPVFTRTLLQLENIPPEKIAISISNPLALQSENLKSRESSKEASESPERDDDGSASKKSPKKITPEVSTSEQDHNIQNVNDSNNEYDNKEEQEEEGSERQKDAPKPVLELDPPDALESFDESMEETSDPQFVVTLNGYDPDGLYSLGEDVDGNNWLKEPVLTSTPNEESPRQHIGSPVVIMNSPAINHSNLIEVELIKSKSTERCKYWPACRLAEKCTFYHPTKPCNVFPACKFGDACLYIHPQCKFNVMCTRKDCVFSHTSAHTPLQPAATPKAKVLNAASAPLPCKFYPNCTNTNCQFAHPQRACRYGLYCTKKDCSFDHGQVAPVDKLKWIRTSTT